MSRLEHVYLFRIPYSDTDAMGTYYNSRALEWFERGRTELCRGLGKPYRQWEQDGVALPIVEAHVEYQGRAQYDDQLRLTTRAAMAGRARMRFDVEVQHASSARPVCRGYTIHAITDLAGRPIRPPQWLLDLMECDPAERPA
ncbi:MAG: thioesterase family protein [Thermoguttaceae bacterium]|jgi:acyl-CoA thioester hydrolase